jgi:outer membrane protein OmpA-like peptidoglycan-associated protein
LPPSDDPDAPVVDYFGEIAQVSGAHRITVLIPTEAGQSLFLRDEVEEVYRFVDGTSSSYRGPILLFMNGLRSESRRRIAESVDEELSTNDVEGVSVEETDSGVRLTLEALRFFPDQAVLLPDERPRLDSVAQALSRVPDARLLIVGHTADIGSVESQQMLSEQRARTIAGELVRRGIDANRLDLEGRAGREPVASNATESGRAQNRRVEIYVLEQ